MLKYLSVFSLAAATLCFAQTKTAGEVYKNVIQLKDTPADQFMPAMQAMSAALGVECSFCHVQGKMEDDSNNHKKIARKMITMTMAINKEHFDGKQETTCYTCHQGHDHPIIVAPVMTVEGARKPKAPPAPANNTLTVDQIVGKWIAASGGAENIRKMQTRVMKGGTFVGETETPIEVWAKAPNLRLSVTKSKEGGSYTTYAGNGGWMGNTGRPARDMQPADAMSASLDAEFHLPLRIKDLYPRMTKGRPERVNGFDCDVLIGAAQPGRPAVRLYFDRESGLLLRMVRFLASPVGRMPVQVDYGDFRALEGVTLPYHWSLARPNGRFFVQIAEIKANAPIEDSAFAKPEGPLK